MESKISHVNFHKLFDTQAMIIWSQAHFDLIKFQYTQGLY